ncbi:hypothetical protein EN780_03280 [Mesorhizobium sp. M4B.F.Ca.ET.089.01.1.1]|uniref:hypothetical protein n=1 Tax=Mesorhizobium sp. M4B.F.Ca.ET.089.01.1.1 TaxID=2496662 RepID=UPI000FE359DA|nr:hypothetical protein [Mesorhizobium sp. M4B.F.Ca.ET.089.01.1.1]RWX70430.1 hypothetical protein EN780_03280 [Mesorhizobium sp. M4B.F.Ca.ET.089.01.1.1]
MDITKRLEALAAMPRNWRVTTHYADGATHHHDTHTAPQAENFAIGERRKIGRDLISRETGETVRVVSVTIGKI